MSFSAYFFNYIFVDIHKKLIKTLYKSIVLISQQFGVLVMLKSMFKPLFGLPGISARITGFVFRVIIIFLSLLLLLFSFGLGLSVYPFFFYILYLGVTKHIILTIFVLCILVLFKFYDYYSNARIPLANVKVLYQLSEAAKLDDRRFVHALEAKDYSELIKLMEDNIHVSHFLSRCELNSKTVFDFLNRQLPVLDEDVFFQNILLLEKKVTYNYLSAALFVTALLLSLPGSDKFLLKYKFSLEELIGCLRYTSYIHYRTPYVWDDDFVLPPSGGVDKGWAVGYSGTLNKYSTDYTKLALKGFMPKLIGRDDVKKEVISVLSKTSRNNVMIIGEPGSGKTTFVQGLAREVATGTSIPSLKYKRFVALDIGSLTSGTQGEINNRLTKIIKEIEAAENIILFIDEIQNLSSTLNSDPNAVSVFSTLEPHLSSGKFQFIGATSRKNYAKYISPNESFTRAFDVVELREATKDETNLIMEDVAKHIEGNTNVLITYNAISSAIKLSKRLIHTSVYPDKSVELLSQSVAMVRNDGEGIVTRHTISKVVSKVSNVPVDQLEQDEKEKLLNLGSILHKRVVGQEQSIDAIVKAIKRARVGVRNEDKPVASFLFSGPTGVGKTETAKTLAEAYYGNEKSMIRIDMSEYQEVSSISRLIGGENGELGVLTSQVKANPNSLVLLDEIEKANRNIHNLFLQVLDDGRLTDSTGSLVDFTNTLIIMTSNVGSHKIVAALAQEGGNNANIDMASKDALKEYFAPEFLNRFTDIITFKPLTKEQVFEITKIKLNILVEKLAEQKMKISFTDEVVKEISKLGFSNEWGVRPLNRVIEDKVETSLANKIIAGEITAGDSYVFDKLE